MLWLFSEKQRGWWRINDSEQLKSCQKVFHSRGIRERDLLGTLERFQDYSCASCTKNKKGKTDQSTLFYNHGTS